MSSKQNLPAGIYANEEYPIHVKQMCDRLWPILRYAKCLPDYKDKSRLDGDKLVINRMRYGIGDIHKLLPDLSAYCAAEKSDD